MPQISVPQNKIEQVLNSTGVNWRWGGTDCHFNVFPANNLEGWSEEERKKLEEAVLSQGWTISKETVHFLPGQRKYWETRLTNGFRINAWREL